MNKVIACVDGAAYTTSVCDAVIWAAHRLSAPLEFLHVLDRHPEHAPIIDFSGSIGLGAQESLLQELSELDEKRGTLAQRHGRALLARLVRRAKDAGVAEVDGRQRHGSLVDSLLDLEPEARLFVLGQHSHATSGARRHLDHNVERVIRSLKRPVLVASAEFKPPQRFAIAFDGSPTGRTMVETVANSPLLKGLGCALVTTGAESASLHDQQAWAGTVLGAAGFAVEACIVAGEPENVLPAWLTAHSIDLLVMGAYGQSRIRHLIVGSTTTTLLRISPIPVLVLR
ncbi:MAG: universal stress protein [Burkholderiaceae bacterium]